MVATLTNWKPYHQKVDNSSSLGEGNFASAAFTMIAAGPPRLAALGGVTAASANISGGAVNFAIPIGAVQNFNMAHNRSFNRFYELGSERSYFISGRTMAQAGLGRILYHGPSLLRVLYAFYNDGSNPTLVPTFGLGITPGSLGSPPIGPNPHDVKIAPGYENLYLNLASDLFSQPCGILVYFKDSNENSIGAVYMEETYVPSHSISADAGGTVIQEAVSLQPERVVPVAITATALVETAPIDSILEAAIAG